MQCIIKSINTWFGKRFNEKWTKKWQKINIGKLGSVCFCVGDSVDVDFLFIVTPIVEVCNCSMFCCTFLYVHSSIAIILMGKRELVALLNLSRDG